MKRQNINTGQRLSPSARKIIKLRQRSFNSGGASLELQIPTNYIRDISRKLNHDITRDVARRNILNWSDDFGNAFWQTAAGSTSTTVDVIANPLNGDITADLLTESNTVSTSHRKFCVANLVSNSCVFSVYVKDNGRRYIRLDLLDTIQSSRTVGFDLTLGTFSNLTTGTTGAITPLVSGWYRISLTYTTATNITNAYIQLCNNASYNAVYTGDNVSGVYLYGAQLESGSTITSYQQTQTLNTDHGASLIMTPNTIGEGRLFNCKPELRNLLVRSEEFDNAAWAKTFVVVTANQVANPYDGLITSDKIVESSSSNTFRQVSYSVTNGDVNGNMYNASVYIRKFANTTNELRYAWVNRISGSDALSRYTVVVDLLTGLVTDVKNLSTASPILTDVSHSVVEVNGYWRISVSARSNFTGTILYHAFGLSNSGTPTYTNNTPSYIGNSLGFIYAWGAQLEQNSTATTYQRTTDGITDFQVTRATTATVVQKDGTIADGCYNLLQYSQDFSNVIWTKPAVTVTSNFAISPNGDNTASKINDFTGTTDHRLIQTITGNNGVTYTASIYLKKYTAQANEMRYFYIQFSSGSDGLSRTGIVIDTQNKVVTDTKIVNTASPAIPISYTFIEVGDYIRVTATTTANSTNNFSIILSLSNSATPTYSVTGIPNYSGNSASFIIIWGAQLTQGSQPKDYLKTTNRLAVPNISYISGLPFCRTELSRTNLLLNSTTLATQNVTVTAQAYTLSFYGTGTITLSGTSSGSLVGTGALNRVTLTFTPTAGTLTLTVTGSVTSAQLEAGSFATSWITTVGASATRNAETAFVDMYNNSLLNSNNFTFYIEGVLHNGGGATRMIALSDTTNGGTNDVAFFDGLKASCAVSSSVTSDTSNLSAGTAFKAIIQRNGTSVKFYRNGSQLWSTQTITAVDYRYLILNNGGSSYSVSKIALWKHTKSDAECVTLTEPIEGIIAKYKFENDATEPKNGLNGTISGGVTFATGVNGNCAVFDGTFGTQIAIADNNLLSFTDGLNDKPFTIKFNIKQTTAGNQFIFAKNSDAAIANDEYRIDINSNAIRILIINGSGDGGRIGIQTTATISLNTFYNIIITYDGSKTNGGIKIYINGVSQSTFLAGGGPPYTGMSNGTRPVTIGTSSNGANRFIGSIDELYIYNRVLSSSEITYLQTNYY